MLLGASCFVSETTLNPKMGRSVRIIVPAEKPLCLSNLNIQELTNASAQWAEQNNFDAVVWTALDSAFYTKAGEAFSPEAALRYPSRLSDDKKAKATEYIQEAPGGHHRVSPHVATTRPDPKCSDTPMSGASCGWPELNSRRLE
jgi:hypothetical protein